VSQIYLKKLQEKYQQLFVSGKVKYKGFVKRHDLGNFFSKNDLGVVFYLQGCSSNEIYCAPNKLYEYISYGLPVLCSDNPSLSFVEKDGIGFKVNISDIKMIRDILVELYNDKDILIKMKNKCNVLFANKYNYERQIEPFISYLKLGAQSPKVPFNSM
jgi:glycosyltransferase involved in cell wall biosynthesis